MGHTPRSVVVVRFTCGFQLPFGQLVRAPPPIAALPVSIVRHRLHPGLRRRLVPGPACEPESCPLALVGDGGQYPVQFRVGRRQPHEGAQRIAGCWCGRRRWPWRRQCVPWSVVGAWASGWANRLGGLIDAGLMSAMRSGRSATARLMSVAALSTASSSVGLAESAPRWRAYGVDELSGRWPVC